jgi:hypothetical protein
MPQRTSRSRPTGLCRRRTDAVRDKARIDPDLIASLRENSRPLRPEASLTTASEPALPKGDANGFLVSAVEDLATRLKGLEERLDRFERSYLRRASVDGHTLFVSSASGYAIVERVGPPPEPGEEVVVEGHSYFAEGYRSSPFPDDPRPCVVVEAARPG